MIPVEANGEKYYIVTTYIKSALLNIGTNSHICYLYAVCDPSFPLSHLAKSCTPICSRKILHQLIHRLMVKRLYKLLALRAQSTKGINTTVLV